VYCFFHLRLQFAVRDRREVSEMFLTLKLLLQGRWRRNKEEQVP
jgi:hypothetical protein